MNVQGVRARSFERRRAFGRSLADVGACGTPVLTGQRVVGDAERADGVQALQRIGDLRVDTLYDALLTKRRMN